MPSFYGVISLCAVTVNNYQYLDSWDVLCVFIGYTAFAIFRSGGKRFYVLLCLGSWVVIYRWVRTCNLLSCVALHLINIFFLFVPSIFPLISSLCLFFIHGYLFIVLLFIHGYVCLFFVLCIWICIFCQNQVNRRTSAGKWIPLISNPFIVLFSGLKPQPKTQVGGDFYFGKMVVCDFFVVPLYFYSIPEKQTFKLIFSNGLRFSDFSSQMVISEVQVLLLRTSTGVG